MSELKKSHTCLKGAIISLLVVFGLGPMNSFAFQARLDAFETKYPAWPDDGTHQCVTCHANNASGGPSLYRTDFSANSSSFSAIENLDSDGDGVKNKDEILVNFHPSWKAGDAELETLGVDISAFLTPKNDLKLSVTRPADVVVGARVTYLLTINNNGPQDATSVIVSNTLPATMNFVSSNPSQGGCSINSGVVTCSLGRINNNGSATISILAVTTAAGTQVNNASVTAGQIELNGGDNSVSTPSNVTATPTPVIPGTKSPFSPSTLLFLILD